MKIFYRALIVALILSTSSGAFAEENQCKGELEKSCKRIDSATDECASPFDPDSLQAMLERAQLARKILKDDRVAENMNLCLKTCEGWGGQKSLGCWKDQGRPRDMTEKQLEKWRQCTIERKLRRCKQMPDKIEKKWKPLVERVLRSKVKSKIKFARDSIESKSYSVAFDYVEDAQETLQYLREANEKVALGVDFPEFDKYEKELEAMTKKLKKLERKKLAGMRCPKGEYKNASLRKKFHPLAKAFFDRDDEESKRDDTVKIFRLEEKPQQKYDHIRRVTHEFAPTIACVEQKKSDGEKTCRIFHLTMHRARPHGGSWSDWKARSVGGGAKMLCENIEK
jgi:hypothetical protein